MGLKQKEQQSEKRNQHIVEKDFLQNRYKYTKILYETYIKLSYEWNVSHKPLYISIFRWVDIKQALVMTYMALSKMSTTCKQKIKKRLHL